MNNEIFVLQYGGEIKAVSSNLKTVYSYLVAECGLLGELQIISYSQLTRYMKKANYYLFFTNSPVAYKISKHPIRKKFLQIVGHKIN